MRELHFEHDDVAGLAVLRCNRNGRRKVPPLMAMELVSRLEHAARHTVATSIGDHFRRDGDPVIGATVTQTGSFVMRTEKVGSDTLLSQIVHMVAEAQRSRAPIQKLADTVAGYFVPAVLLIAVVTFIVWAVLGPVPALAYALVNAVAVLIIACPCALGLATPMSIMVGVGRAAQTGILIKSAEAIEKAGGKVTLPA